MTKVVIFTSDKGDIPANLAFTNNLSASTNPAVTDDSSKGYVVGSQWINQATQTSYIALGVAVGAANWVVDAQGGSLNVQPTPASQDTAATLTAAQILTGIITSNPAGAVNLQLPLATAMDTALPQSVANSSVDFSVVNTNATNADTITTNTGWTLVGSMIVALSTTGRFRARKTATGAWTLYRIS